MVNRFRARALRLWYAVLAFLTAACAVGVKHDPFPPDPPVTLAPTAPADPRQFADFWLDPSLSNREAAAVADAAMQWGSFTDAQITLHTGPHVCTDVGCVNVIAVDQALLDSIQGNLPTTIGETTYQQVLLSHQSNWDELQWTAIHEMGHALGLSHPCTAICNDYAVMNPTYTQGADHVACADVDAYFDGRSRAVPPGVTHCTDTRSSLTAEP
jgi:hypothetical protein